jgi:hypothetical protein
MVDGITYRREDGRNRLKMSKELQPAP